MHRHCRHRITVDLPVDAAFMLFTPAGEELWVDGWAPRYVHPSDGRTEAGEPDGVGPEHDRRRREPARGEAAGEVTGAVDDGGEEGEDGGHGGRQS